MTSASGPERKRAYRSKPFAYKSGSGAGFELPTPVFGRQGPEVQIFSPRPVSVGMYDPIGHFVYFESHGILRQNRNSPRTREVFTRRALRAHASDQSFIAVRTGAIRYTVPGVFLRKN